MLVLLHIQVGARHVIGISKFLRVVCYAAFKAQPQITMVLLASLKRETGTLTVLECASISRDGTSTTDRCDAKVWDHVVVTVGIREFICTIRARLTYTTPHTLAWSPFQHLWPFAKSENGV